MIGPHCHIRMHQMHIVQIDLQILQYKIVEKLFVSPLNAKNAIARVKIATQFWGNAPRSPSTFPI